MLAVAEIDDRLVRGQPDAASTVAPPIKAPRYPVPVELMSRATSRTAVDVKADGTPATVPIAPPPVRSDGFKLLQQWEGVVSEVDRDKGEFAGVLRDLTNRNTSEETAAFAFDQIDPPDWPLVIAGAVFYWWIGYK